MQTKDMYPGSSGFKIVCLAASLLLLPITAWGTHKDKRSGAHKKSSSKIVVQQIGEIAGDFAADISKQVRIIPFSRRNDARKTPIIFPGGLFFQADGSVGGLGNKERRGIQQAYRAGQTIVVLDATVHDIAALHALIGEGAAYDSATDPVATAYTLRRVNSIPTARVLTHARLSPREAVVPEDDALTFTRAVGIVLNDLSRPAAPPPEEDQSCGGAGQPACWTDTPVQSTILAINSSAGVFNTTVNLYALHECSSGRDQYVVTAEADWTATQAKFQSASDRDGTLGLDSDFNLVVDWQNNRNYCTGGIDLALGNSICRYINYPLRYAMKVVPPTTGTIIQVQSMPAATSGTTEMYSSGITIGISGSVNISGTGPSAGLKAGVAWNNTTTADVPSLLVEAGNTGNEGAFWNYVYCTSGSDSGDCVSNVQMTGTSATCRDFEMGEPQNGQTPDGKLSATGQSVQFEAEPDTRVGDTFDITVTFTADLATTTTYLWYGPFLNDPGLLCLKNGLGPSGYCNCFGCSCKNSTVTHPATASLTFKVPFPSTLCTQ